MDTTKDRWENVNWEMLIGKTCTFTVKPTHYVKWKVAGVTNACLKLSKNFKADYRRESFTYLPKKLITDVIIHEPEPQPLNTEQRRNKLLSDICEHLDYDLYLPVKEELENTKVRHSLGIRKENFK